MEQDFAAGTNLEGLRDAHISTALWGGRATIGHFKPYRSMEELTSSNEILMMERPFASATGLFNGRQFQQGVGYLKAGGNYTFGVTEQLIFPEIDYDKVERVRGMDITFVTSANTDEECKVLLEQFGFPFKK